jgi:hypothetical protein
VAAIALAGIAGVTTWTLKPTPRSPASRFAVSVAPSARVNLSLEQSDVAIARDGTRVVYRAADDGLHVRAFDELLSMPLRVGQNASSPFISPDGAWVGFQAGEGGPMQKVLILGGPPVTICDLPTGRRLEGASWGPDDAIIFASGGGLWQVEAVGGNPKPLTVPDGHRWPEILPGGASVLFTISDGLGTVDDQIAMLDLETGEHRVVIPDGTYPRYSPTGHIVYGFRGTLRAVAFDLETLDVTSDPIPVLEEVVTKRSGAAVFDLSDTGSLVYVNGAGEGEQVMVWVDRQGNEEPIAAEPRW